MPQSSVWSKKCATAPCNCAWCRSAPLSAVSSAWSAIVSKELGKDIKLEISGAETEVDKSVVEKIGDPLMHLVRNAMDHGIERAEVRAQRGKPVQGVLSSMLFTAQATSSSKSATMAADSTATKSSLKPSNAACIPEAAFSDQEIYALIFEPGFSTAEQVSNLSGRGVGMDVVKAQHHRIARRYSYR